MRKKEEEGQEGHPRLEEEEGEGPMEEEEAEQEEAEQEGTGLEEEEDEQPPPNHLHRCLSSALSTGKQKHSSDCKRKNMCLVCFYF